MEILKDAGTFEVVHVTHDPIGVIAKNARVCYQSKEFASEENDHKLVKHLIEVQHFPMLEFADLNVIFDLVCRGFTHEDVRHRLCNFGQESTRRVDESEFKVVVPPHRDENEPILDTDHHTFSLKDWFSMNEAMYRALREKGWVAQDARQVLPIAIKSQIAHKANLREWRHIFDMRCAPDAHWEIKRVMINLLIWCKCEIPLIFDDYYFFNMDDPNKRYARRILPKTLIERYIKEFHEAHPEDLIDA